MDKSLVRNSRGRANVAAYDDDLTLELFFLALLSSFIIITGKIFPTIKFYHHYLYI